MNKELMGKFYTAYHWLDCHPCFIEPGDFDGGIKSFCIEVVMINPENKTIELRINSDGKTEENDELNTEVEIWIEGGPWSDDAWHNPYADDHSDDGGWMHDIELDCGAPTFEEAVIKFVELVRAKYGNYHNYACVNNWLAIQEGEKVITSRED